MLSHESAGDGDSQEQAEAAGRVYEKLFHAFAPIIGSAGVDALFARSVALSAATFPCLKEMSRPAEPIGGSAMASALVGCLREQQRGAATEVATHLYAHLVGLMAKLIGAGLVWQIARSAFPALGDAETIPKERK